MPDSFSNYFPFRRSLRSFFFKILFLYLEAVWIGALHEWNSLYSSSVVIAVAALCLVRLIGARFPLC